jgi:Arc/MetJ-type ribon-helix-helix transcriptional regulator
METKKITFYISLQQLKLLDEAARANFCTRSDYIRAAVMLRLQGEQAIQQQKEAYLESLKKFERHN